MGWGGGGWVRCGYNYRHHRYRAQELAVWKSSRWSSWALVPNKPTVSVDVKQHFNNPSLLILHLSHVRTSQFCVLLQPVTTSHQRGQPVHQRFHQPWVVNQPNVCPKSPYQPIILQSHHHRCLHGLHYHQQRQGPLRYVFAAALSTQSTGPRRLLIWTSE